jgi:hypothetical protein
MLSVIRKLNGDMVNTLGGVADVADDSEFLIQSCGYIPSLAAFGIVHQYEQNIETFVSCRQFSPGTQNMLQNAGLLDNEERFYFPIKTTVGEIQYRNLSKDCKHMKRIDVNGLVELVAKAEAVLARERGGVELEEGKALLKYMEEYQTEVTNGTKKLTEAIETMWKSVEYPTAQKMPQLDIQTVKGIVEGMYANIQRMAHTLSDLFSFSPQHHSEMFSVVKQCTENMKELEQEFNTVSLRYMEAYIMKSRDVYLSVIESADKSAQTIGNEIAEKRKNKLKNIIMSAVSVVNKIVGIVGAVVAVAVPGIGTVIGGALVVASALVEVGLSIINQEYEEALGKFGNATAAVIATNNIPSSLPKAVISTGKVADIQKSIVEYMSTVESNLKPLNISSRLASI